MENTNKKRIIPDSIAIFIIILFIVLLSITFLLILYIKDNNDLKKQVLDDSSKISMLQDTVNNLNSISKNFKDNKDNQQCSFMDTYIALCPIDGKGLYHKYNCPYYDSSKSFYIFNINQAENEGFSPCPYCEPSDTSNFQNNTQVVYITHTGSKYHRSSCSYLDKSKIAIDKDDAINEGYEPCSKCNP